MIFFEHNFHRSEKMKRSLISSFDHVTLTFDNDRKFQKRMGID